MRMRPKKLQNNNYCEMRGEREIIIIFNLTL